MEENKNLDWLESIVENQPEPQPQPEPTPEPEAAKPESVAEVPEGGKPEAVAEEVVEEPVDRRVPLSELINERKKRQSFQNEVDELKAELNSYYRGENYPEQVDEIANLQEQIAQMKLEYNYNLIKERMGDIVDEAKDWAIEKCLTDKLFAQSIDNNKDDVFNYIIGQYKNDRLINRFANDRESLYNELKQEFEPQQVVPEMPVPAKPKTINNLNNKSNTINQVKGFGDIFK